MVVAKGSVEDGNTVDALLLLELQCFWFPFSILDHGLKDMNGSSEVKVG